MIAAAWLAALALGPAAEAKVVKVDEGNVVREVLEFQGPVVLYFYNRRCSDCAATSPFIKQLSDEYGGKAKFAVTEIFEAPRHWSDEWEGFKPPPANAATLTRKEKMRFGPVRVVPVLMFIRDGREVGRLSPEDTVKLKEGEPQRDVVRCLIDQFIGVPKDRSPHCPR